MVKTNKIAKTFVDAVTFNDERTTYTSDAFNISDYREMCMMINKTVEGTPTDILVQVEVSDDNSTFCSLENNFWSNWRYEDSAGTQNEAVKDTCPFMYVRIKITATGTDATNTFTVTVKGMFMD